MSASAPGTDGSPRHDASEVAGLDPAVYRCPQCGQSRLGFQRHEVRCRGCEAVFPVVDGKPLLVPHDNEFFTVLSQPSPTRVGRPPGVAGALQRLVPSPGVNLARADCMTALVQAVSQRRAPTMLVLGAGNQREELSPLLAAHPHVGVVYSDVDPGALIDLYADAQCIPFADEVFDAVIATGIISTMLYPERAVAEIHRVLSEGGLVYSEVPFVQQVAFGPHDFRRYSLSGHRHLFRDFEEVNSGPVAGPATVLYWAIETLALCFAPGRRARMAVKGFLRTLLSWIKYLDHVVIRRPAAVDGASNTFFLGRKRAGHLVSDADIVGRYEGAQ